MIALFSACAPHPELLAEESGGETAENPYVDNADTGTPAERENASLWLSFTTTWSGEGSTSVAPGDTVDVGGVFLTGTAHGALTQLPLVVWVQNPAYSDEYYPGTAHGVEAMRHFKECGVLEATSETLLATTAHGPDETGMMTAVGDIPIGGTYGVGVTIRCTMTEIAPDAPVAFMVDIGMEAAVTATTWDGNRFTATVDGRNNGIRTIVLE